VKLGLRGACALALLSACGGTKPSAPPAPVPGPEPAPVPPAPSSPLRYRLRGPLVYEIERYDSLFYASMPGAPQGTAKRSIVTVRPLSGRTNDVEVRLDSLVGLEDTRLTSTTIDSSIGSRWQFTLGPEGPKGIMLGAHPTILAGQIEAAIRLLFPQLPPDGLGKQAVWSDSTGYRLQLDAFDAFETAARTSQAVPGSPMPSPGATGVTVEANERLSRSGTAVQAGQTMTLKGSGVRRVRYEFAPDGWVNALTAQDSLDLVVTVGPGGEAVPIRWRSTLIGRLRDLPLR
jgi:hypothetical protein